MTDAKSLSPKILIADDDPLVCQLIRINLLNAGFDHLTVATGGREAIALAASLEPDLMLLDIAMPDLDGLEVLNLVKDQTPATLVIMLTAHRKSSYLVHAIALGASGYLIKGMLDLNTLGQTVKLALAGDTVIVDQRLLQEAAKEAPVPINDVKPMDVPSVESLTRQEREVLKLLAGGFSNAEIGAALHISYNTVKSHVSSIYGKLQVSDRTQAAVFALRQGIGVD